MASATQIQVIHDADCPEISPVHCAEPGGLPLHTHHQGMMLARVNGLVGVGLGKGFQIKGELPFDLKQMTIEYKDEAGKPYDPPYLNIHHRNETISGPSDAKLHLEYFRKAGESWTVGGSFGATIPIGKTEEDPYERAKRSVRHQHIQMGSGTVNPVATLSLVYGGHRWGMLANAQGMAGLYHNAKEYMPSSSLAIGAGPTYRATSKLMLMTSAEVLHETRAYWGDTPDPMSGRTAIIGAAGMVYRLNTTTALMAQGRVTAAQWSIADQIVQPFVAVLGVTITPQKD